MNRDVELSNIHSELLEAGYGGYAYLIPDGKEKTNGDMSFVLGVAGDDLTGKSSIINYVLDQNILPTSVIPSKAEITITVGDENSDEENEKDMELSERIEEEEYVEVVTSNEFMKSNRMTIKEFHGLVGREKSADLELLSDAYKCDKMIFVMSAEHLLSEAENIFIENYVKFVGADNLLVIINKVDLLADSDVGNVLEYARKQIESRYEKVKWVLFDKSGKRHAGNCEEKEIKNLLKSMVEVPQNRNDALANNMLDYISEQLSNECSLLEKDKEKNFDAIVKENEKISQMKKNEETTIEETLIEFKQKKNRLSEKIDILIKEGFEKITNELLQEFSSAANKCAWYKNELERKWQQKVNRLSEDIDKAETETICNDVNWINSILETQLGQNSITLEMKSYRISGNDKVVPYGAYKKYVPIGSGGIAVIGFCLFRMVGAVVGVGSGLLAYAILELKDATQNEELKNQLSTKIRDVSVEIRKMSTKEIELIYMNILSEFKKEAKTIIDDKYKEKSVNEDVYSEKIMVINQSISHIKEVKLCQ